MSRVRLERRAERVVNFCSEAKCEEFVETIPALEPMLNCCGITLLKYYLDIVEPNRGSAEAHAVSIP